MDVSQFDFTSTSASVSTPLCKNDVGLQKQRYFKNGILQCRLIFRALHLTQDQCRAAMKEERDPKVHSGEAYYHQVEMIRCGYLFVQ